MEHSKIWLKKDKSCYLDLKTKELISNDKTVSMTERFVNFLVYLCENKERPCKYEEIFVNAIDSNNPNAVDKYYKYENDPVVDIRKQLSSQLEKCGYNISIGNKKKDKDKYDITIINDKANQTYLLYLGNDYSDIEANEMYRQQIADFYYSYDNYRSVVDSPDDSGRINWSIMEVFCFPDFAGGKCLDLSERKNVFVCAPNGFGKSTLLKAILLATNPSSKLNEQPELAERIDELKKHYGIKKDYLTIFVNLKDVNTRNAFKRDEDLCKWLLNASKLDSVIQLDEFRNLIAHYSQKERLMLIFDSLDELVQETEINIGREEVLTKIRTLISADEIGRNAKVIIASRPLAFSEDDMLYNYLYIESLISNRESVETIIGKYSPKYKDKLVSYIFGDLYLKHLIVTPQLLISVIRVTLLDWLNVDTGIIEGKGKFELIKSIFHDTMIRFYNRARNVDIRKYEYIYEIFAYVSLYNDVKDKREDFAAFQKLIIENRLNKVHHLNTDDIIDAYEHFCLFNSQGKGKNLEFLAENVMRPFYLAVYMYRFYQVEKYDEAKIRNEFDAIIKHKGDEYLYDILVFFFGIIHEGIGIHGDGKYNPDRPEYKVWVDYVVHRWNTVSKDETSKKTFSDRLKYLLESDFVRNSCFDIILGRDIDLNDNEMQLKFILNEIK